MINRNTYHTIIYITFSFTILLYETCIGQSNNKYNQEIKYSFYGKAFNDSIKSKILYSIEMEKKFGLVDSIGLDEKNFFLILGDYDEIHYQFTLELEYCNPKLKSCEGMSELIKASNRFYELNTKLTLPVIFDHDIDFIVKDNAYKYSIHGGFKLVVDYKKKSIEVVFED